jgi:hypothetical protein
MKKPAKTLNPLFGHFSTIHIIKTDFLEIQFLNLRQVIFKGFPG